MKTKGFTLVELLVVIAILAILATVSVVGYTSFIAGADEQAAITEAKELKSMVDAGLTLKDYVKLNDTYMISVDDEGVYSIAAPSPAPAAKDVHDASADYVLTGVIGLTDDSKGLTYTINGYTVDLSTMTATEAESE